MDDVMMEKVVIAIENATFSAAEQNERGESANIVDGLFAIARGLEAVAKAVQRLGNNDAATSMGAIEALGKVMSEAISGAGEAVAEAIGSAPEEE